MMPSNALRPCNEGNPTLLSFVSSTLTLKTDLYARLFHKQAAIGGKQCSGPMICMEPVLALALVIAKLNGYVDLLYREEP